jgi:hypothetical protein
MYDFNLAHAKELVFSHLQVLGLLTDMFPSHIIIFYFEMNKYNSSIDISICTMVYSLQIPP